MSVEALSPLRPPVVAALPGSPAKGDTVVLAADGHLYTYNGSAWVDNGAAGSGGALALNAHVISSNFTITAGNSATVERYVEIALATTLEIGLDGDLGIS